MSVRVAYTTIHRPLAVCQLYADGLFWRDGVVGRIDRGTRAIADEQEPAVVGRLRVLIELHVHLVLDSVDDLQIV